MTRSEQSSLMRRPVATNNSITRCVSAPSPGSRRARISKQVLTSALDRALGSLRGFFSRGFQVANDCQLAHQQSSNQRDRAEWQSDGGQSRPIALGLR